jgi:hypothetical protein
MTKGETWRSFLEHKGWIVNDVITGGEAGKVLISVRPGRETGTTDDVAIGPALILREFDILCYETRTGTVFFQWDDITQVKLEVDKKKRGWL